MGKRKPAKRARSKKSGVTQTMTKNPIASIVVITLIILGVYFGGQYVGWWGAAPTEPTPEPTPTVSTVFEFKIIDLATGEEMDDDQAQIEIYTADITDLDADEIADLEYSDYALDATKESGDTFTPDEDEVYWCKVIGDDVVPLWFEPLVGMNTLYVMNMTEDVSIVAIETEKAVVFENGTGLREWTISTYCLDDPEGVGEVTNNEGFMSYYDFESDSDISLVLRIKFNSTASLSWCSFESGNEVVEKIAGEYMYYEISGIIRGKTDFDIKLGSGIGVDFEVEEISFGYGSADDYTEWDAVA